MTTPIFLEFFFVSIDIATVGDVIATNITINIIIIGAPVLFHHKALSPYSCYELTFHQLLTFIVLFLTYDEQLKSYYATNSRKTAINLTTTCLHRLRLLASRLLSRHILSSSSTLQVYRPSGGIKQCCAPSVCLSVCLFHASVAKEGVLGIRLL